MTVDVKCVTSAQRSFTVAITGQPCCRRFANAFFFTLATVGMYDVYGKWDHYPTEVCCRHSPTLRPPPPPSPPSHVTDTPPPTRSHPRTRVDTRHHPPAARDDGHPVVRHDGPCHSDVGATLPSLLELDPDRNRLPGRDAPRFRRRDVRTRRVFGISACRPLVASRQYDGQYELHLPRRVEDA